MITVTLPITLPDDEDANAIINLARELAETTFRYSKTRNHSLIDLALRYTIAICREIYIPGGPERAAEAAVRRVFAETATETVDLKALARKVLARGTAVRAARDKNPGNPPETVPHPQNVLYFPRNRDA